MKQHYKKRNSKQNTGISTNSPRLAFLSNILIANGISQKELAKRLVCTPQAISHMFRSLDDCSLSRAQEIALVIGLSLSVEFAYDTACHPFLHDSFTSGSVSNRIVTIGLDHLSRVGGVKLPQHIMTYPDCGRLRFLRDFLIDTGMPLCQIEHLCGFSASTISRCFLRNNIFISTIYAIAQSAGVEIKWVISSRQSDAY